MGFSFEQFKAMSRICEEERVKNLEKTKPVSLTNHKIKVQKTHNEEWVEVNLYYAFVISVFFNVFLLVFLIVSYFR